MALTVPAATSFSPEGCPGQDGTWLPGARDVAAPTLGPHRQEPPAAGPEGLTTVHTIATPSPARSAARPAPPALPGRRLAAVGLVVGATLNTAEAVLGQFLPAKPEGLAEQLSLVAENAALYGTRAVLGTLAVPFMVIAFLGAARLLAGRARRTGAAAGTLLAAGMWGFVGVHVLGLLQLPASRGDIPAAAAVLDGIQSSPVLGALFFLPFLAGTVLGLLLLTGGLLRTGAVPRWIPATWLAFLLLDFSIGAVGPVDPHWLFLAGSVGLAAHLIRRADTGSKVS
jgi:hypothetical protein